jgi:hypothetical protein
VLSSATAEAGWSVFVWYIDIHERFRALQAAECEPVQRALPVLNELAALMRGGLEQPFEIEEARADTFLAICEIAKALHRGQPENRLWQPAIDAAKRWMSLAGHGEARKA